ncbi:putative ribonuclease H protein [Citrus sinensis]|uniref:Ribonuclease H protein n=1 Tax=Citrus sinensis TaxID=2711 RepID=A0ACB8KAE6_CITSI|nr:putative ribonuclease H protein [Citrus sinensis]
MEEIAVHNLWRVSWSLRLSDNALTGCFPPIDIDMLHMLQAPIDDNEVRSTIFSMKPLKAPGVDGLHAVFYQSQWSIVGPSVCSFIKNIFENKHIPREINRTLLVFIPKVANPLNLKIYRPISLCTVIYKTLTKLIANRLQTILPHVIGPRQTSFVPGRHIIENIVVAQEVIHSMRRKSGRRGYMAIKVDLEKAYDRLSHGISKAVADGVWRPVRLSRNGIPLSHLFFTDDLLLLAEASSDQARIVNSVLEDFCISSGAKINRTKTQLFFSKTIHNGEASRIGNFLGFTMTKDLGKYLGMPLLHSRVTMNTYHDIVDKVEKRLSGWNASQLSLAGRITLTQSVLQAIPVYAMQTSEIPAGVINKINQICKRFIWSGSNENRKMSLIGWDKVCQPKICGGLGLKNLGMMNKALMMKLAWGLVSEPTSLWCRVLYTKYGIADSDFPLGLPTRSGSHLWKSIGKVWSDTLKGLWWNIRNGRRVHFWLDCWVTNHKPLSSYALAPIPVESLMNLVVDFIDTNGNWCWASFEHLLPNCIILRIAAVQPPMEGKGDDKFFWANSQWGDFSVKSAYMAITENETGIEHSRWNIAWKWKGPPCVQTFIWLALHDRLKTKAEIGRRHIHIDWTCDHCGVASETTLHVLRDCFMARRLWNQLLPKEITSSNKSGLNGPTRKVEKWIGWQPPVWPLCKLNSDGACRRNGGSFARGILRNSNGDWVSGFAMNIGYCSVTIAELWGVYQGLVMAWDHGIRWLLVDVNS